MSDHIDLLRQNGFKVLYEISGGDVSVSWMVETFGWALIVGMVRSGRYPDRRWFFDMNFEQASYAFKSEADAVFFKLMVSPSGMVTHIL